VIQFVDEVRERFGVEPVCRVLSQHGVRIAPRTYYAAKSRPASNRVVRDAAVTVEIERVHADPQLGRGLYGVRKSTRSCVAGAASRAGRSRVGRWNG
jgi:putative transposase